MKFTKEEIARAEAKKLTKEQKEALALANKVGMALSKIGAEVAK